MTRPIAAVAAGALFSALAVSGITPATAATTSFSSCTKLHKVYRYGVAKSAAAAASQVRTHHYRPAYSKQAQKVYWANYKRLDRDHDGTACEVTK